jgi:hypothetical protein
MTTVLSANAPSATDISIKAIITIGDGKYLYELPFSPTTSTISYEFDLSGHWVAASDTIDISVEYSRTGGTTGSTLSISCFAILDAYFN